MSQDLPVELIEQALAGTGTATVRQRRLPAQQVVWLVLGLAMFRHLNIVQVVDQLGLALPKGKGAVVASAIHKARKRLGPMPLQWLFQATAEAWAHKSAAAHKFHGLSVYGVDGTTLRVPDSPENREHFGGTKTQRGKSGYPLCRMAALMALRSHLVAAAAFGPYAVGEHSYAQALWDQLPDNSVVALDRGFLAAVVLYRLLASGKNRHYLIRLKKNTKLQVLKRLGPGDELVQMQVSDTARRKHPELPKTLVARRLIYQRKGYQPQALLTSLVDPVEYPAKEVVALYHERWELELGYDEIKTEMLDRQETLRSLSPWTVEQEVWGTLLAYNLVRLEMERVAQLAGVEPVQLSFSGMLMMLMQLWQVMSLSLRAKGAIPKLISSWESQMQRLLLPPRRSHRNYPRAVKIKMSNYPRNRPATVAGRA
jgi:hypothetical protein